MTEEDIKMFETLNVEQSLSILNLLLWLTSGFEKNPIDAKRDIENVIEILSKASKDGKGINMKWISVEDKLPQDLEKVLAVYRSRKGGIYNLLATGWSRDTIYPCNFYKEKFVIAAHGLYPHLPATHWMPMLELPEQE